MKRVVVAIIGLILSAAVFAQGIPNFLPPNTVVGRLASNPGPTSAIPFATLAAQLGIGSTYLAASSVAGTNAITSITTAAPALASGQTVLFTPANTNTSATTFNRDSTGAINVFFNGAALTGGELRAGVPVILYYDGTQYNILSNGAAPFIPTARQLTNSLSGNVALNNTSNYFDGPTVAQGTSGTWFFTGGVTLSDTNLNSGVFSCKLWDGTTVIDSRQSRGEPSSGLAAISLSGVLASPAASVKISCKDATNSSNANILSNGSGNSKDSTLTAIRIQ